MLQWQFRPLRLRRCILHGSVKGRKLYLQLWCACRMWNWLSARKREMSLERLLLKVRLLRNRHRFLFRRMVNTVPVYSQKQANNRHSQSNCGQPTVPSCGVDEQTALQRRIGYYEGWAASRKCSSFTPEQIDAATLTHINFAFGLVSSSFEIVEMTAGDADLWKRTTALKEGNPSLKVFLSVGGWTANDPPTQTRFSDLASSEDNMNAFAKSCFEVMQTYGFDVSISRLRSFLIAVLMHLSPSIGYRYRLGVPRCRRPRWETRR